MAITAAVCRLLSSRLCYAATRLACFDLLSFAAPVLAFRSSPSQLCTTMPVNTGLCLACYAAPELATLRHALPATPQLASPYHLSRTLPAALYSAIPHEALLRLASLARPHSTRQSPPCLL